MQLIELVGQLQVRHMLLDINTFPDISVYDQVWMSMNWMPTVVKSRLEQVVLAIGRRKVHNQLALDSLIAGSRPLIKFDIQFFPTALPGLHWLSNYSDRLPLLLAEWDRVHGPGLPPHILPEQRSSYVPGF